MDHKILPRCPVCDRNAHVHLWHVPIGKGAGTDLICLECRVLFWWDQYYNPQHVGAPRHLVPGEPVDLEGSWYKYEHWEPVPCLNCGELIRGGDARHGNKEGWKHLDACPA